jgi:peptide/nickel transport system ATP-binding protein
VPSPAAPIEGCRFKGRCWLREQLGFPEICETEEPALRVVAPGQQTACHFAEEIDPRRIADAATVVVPPAADAVPASA